MGTAAESKRDDERGARLVALTLHVLSLVVPVVLPMWMSKVKAFSKWHNGGERLCLAVATTLSHAISYWMANLYYHLVSKIASLKKYQIPHKTREKGNKPELVQAALLDAAVGSAIITPIAMYFVFPIIKNMNVNTYAELPSVGRMLRDFVLSYFFTDATFYWSHRILHHPLFYARIHKQHHEFKATTGFAAEYDHPVEDILNILTTVGGPLLLGSHGAVFAAWIAFRVHQTVDAHSGFALPFPYSLWCFGPGTESVERHDYHHTDNLGNFGDWLPLWDWMCGTDKHWKASKAKALKKQEQQIEEAVLKEAVIKSQ